MAVSSVCSLHLTSVSGTTSESVSITLSEASPEKEFIESRATSASLRACSSRNSASFSLTSAISKSLRSVYSSSTRCRTTSNQAATRFLETGSHPPPFPHRPPYSSNTGLPDTTRRSSPVFLRTRHSPFPFGISPVRLSVPLPNRQAATRSRKLRTWCHAPENTAEFYGRKFPVEFQRVTHVAGIGISAQRRKEISLSRFFKLLRMETALSCRLYIPDYRPSPFHDTAARIHSPGHGLPAPVPACSTSSFFYSSQYSYKIRETFFIGHTFLLFIHPVWIFYRKSCTGPE